VPFDFCTKQGRHNLVSIFQPCEEILANLVGDPVHNPKPSPVSSEVKGACIADHTRQCAKIQTHTKVGRSGGESSTPLSFVTPPPPFFPRNFSRPDENRPPRE
jgi:hypothetical protein